MEWPILSIHIRDKITHGISDSCESLPMAVPRVDPQSHLQNGLSCAHSPSPTDPGARAGCNCRSWCEEGPRAGAEALGKTIGNVGVPRTGLHRYQFAVAGSDHDLRYARVAHHDDALITLLSTQVTAARRKSAREVGKRSYDVGPADRTSLAVSSLRLPAAVDRHACARTTGPKSTETPEPETCDHFDRDTSDKHVYRHIAELRVLLGDAS